MFVKVQSRVLFDVHDHLLDAPWCLASPPKSSGALLYGAPGLKAARRREFPGAPRSHEQVLGARPGTRAPKGWVEILKISDIRFMAVHGLLGREVSVCP